MGQSPDPAVLLFIFSNLHTNAHSTYFVWNASVEKWLFLKFKDQKKKKKKTKKSLEFCDSSSHKVAFNEPLTFHLTNWHVKF